MQFKKNGLAILIITLISGCAIYGPTYSKPSVKTPKQWNNRDYLANIESANLPAIAWWKKFDDQQLNHLIESALNNNNNIQVAIGNIQSAEGQLQQIQYSWIPTINAIAGYANNPSNLMPLGYGASLLPNYTINIFQLIRSAEYAKANLRAVTAAKDAVRLSIITQTVSGYFTLLGQDYQLKLQKQLVADLESLLKLSKIQNEKGLISLYALQQFEQQYEQAKAQLPVIENNIVSSQNALRVLLNQNPGDIKRGLSFMDLKSDGVIPVNLPSDVLKNRPDIQQAEQQLIAANANVGVATSTFFPTISLTNNVGTAAPALGSLFTPANEFWNSQISANMPILNFSIYGQIKQAKGQYSAAYYNYIQTVRSAFASVDNDLSAHDKYYRSLVIQNKNYTSSKIAYNLADISYQKGLYSYPTLLQNRINMDNAAIVLSQSKQAQLNTIVQLYQDLAGGYLVESSTLSRLP